MSDSGESQYLYKEACPKCGSRDNLARYSDGHGHCFGCSHYEPGNGESPTIRRKPSVAEDFDPIIGEYEALPKRGLTEETCRHFGYQIGELPYKDDATDTWLKKKAHIAPYYKDGVLVAQHFRDSKKEFPWRGTSKGVELFGQHLWRDGGKKVVITEGEIDAMTVSQLQGNKWPVVSIPCGVKSAARSIKDNLEWLERFDEVILMFDMDVQGHEATMECAPLFTPGRCKVASLPLKDANEMLKKGRGAEVVAAIWGAKAYRPDGIQSVADLFEEAIKDIEWGTAWWLDALTQLTYGRRKGECYAFGAGTGIGKTDWFTQSISYDANVLGLTVGLLYLEQPPVETLRRVAGKLTGKVMHVPGKATVEERREAMTRLRDDDRIHFYNSTGAAPWETIKAKIRFMVVALGCTSIYLDHLTALVAGAEDERKALDAIMAELAALALELNVFVHFISHLTRPPSSMKPHEEGGRVKQSQFRGSNAIGMWSHFMFGLERNTQGTEEADKVTTFRVIKDRYTGQATGKLIYLGYDVDTGLLFETDAPAPESSHFPDRSTSTSYSSSSSSTNEEF